MPELSFLWQVESAKEAGKANGYLSLQPPAHHCHYMGMH